MAENEVLYDPQHEQVGGLNGGYKSLKKMKGKGTTGRVDIADDMTCRKRRNDVKKTSLNDRKKIQVAVFTTIYIKQV
jgi:hypothetical protein